MSLVYPKKHIKAEMKKIVIIGNGKLAIDCTRTLIDHAKANIEAILYNPDESTFSEMVERVCEQHSIINHKINKKFVEADIELIKQISPDLIFNILSDNIFPKEILDLPKIGAINFHNGPLPLYRGHGHVIPFWAIMNNEKVHGVTWHFMDEGIDTGDIIKVKHFAIDNDETALSLNFKCIVEGKELFQEIIDDILTDNYKCVPQAGRSSRYLSKHIPNNGYINFNWPRQKIERFIRATDYRPFSNLFTYAKVKHINQSFIVNSIKTKSITDKQDYQNGEIIDLSDQFIRVAAKDSVVDITETMHTSDHEILINELIHTYKINKGDILNVSKYEEMSLAS